MRFPSSLPRFQHALITPASFPSQLPRSLQHIRRSYATKFAAPAAAPPPQSDTATPDQPRQHVAILGAGITGLSAAYHLLLTPNPPRITIYESKDRAGGWMQSEYVELDNGSGSVLFESGPRNIRPTVPVGLATVALWEDLGLAGNMIVTPKRSDAAQKRWLYYPDHLVELPSPSRGLISNAWSLLTEPVFHGFMKDVLYEMSVPPRSASLEDESVGDFISRRVNKRLVDQVASAVLHGIYAGDAWQLSARSVLRDAWWAEKHAGSVTRGMLAMQSEAWMLRRHAELLEHLSKTQRPSGPAILQVNGASTVTLDGGMGMFAERLKQTLEKIGNVEFKMEEPVKSVGMAEDGNGIELTSTRTTSPQKYDQIISTIPSASISYLTLSEANPRSFEMLATYGPTVNVVNLFYSQTGLLPITGFGYLIPQGTPLKHNPELALGVVFDSEVVPFGQDRLSVLDTSRPEEPRGTKVTVMLGGHWYDAFDSVPDEQLALQHAKDLLKRHLGITAQPAASKVSKQQWCIPQYKVGHTARLKSAHNELLRRFGGRLKLAGSSYGGVSVNDCVVAGMEIAGYAAGGEDNWSNKTGLEWADAGDDLDFVRGPEYFLERGMKVSDYFPAKDGSRTGEK